MPWRWLSASATKTWTTRGFACADAGHNEMQRSPIAEINRTSRIIVAIRRILSSNSGFSGLRAA